MANGLSIFFLLTVSSSFCVIGAIDDVLFVRPDTCMSQPIHFWSLIERLLGRLIHPPVYVSWVKWSKDLFDLPWTRTNAIIV
jgi:hypothetical protein